MRKQFLQKRFHAFKENPLIVFSKFNYTKIQKLLPDEIFMKLMLHAKVGYKLDLKNPKSFNEKMQWIKLNDRKPVYTQMVDKYEAKLFVESLVGSEYIVPSYGVWDSFEDIDFNILPDQFVLKTTHDCGGVVICKDKKVFDYNSAKANLSSRLKTNFFWQGREWPYLNVKPRILAEKYLEPSTQSENPFTYDNGKEKAITDYKIMCFDGKPYCCLVCMGRDSKEGLHENFYDREWKLLPFRRSSPVYDGEVTRPVFFDKMLELSEILSNGTLFLRVDFFENNNQLYVGELTFFPASGFGPFIPEEWDFKLGELIKLRFEGK